MKYVDLHKELQEMFQKDQAEVKKHSQLFKRAPDSPDLETSRKRLTEKNRERSKRLLEILEFMDLPTVSNIGKDGLLWISVIALHAQERILRTVLEAYEKVLELYPEEMDASLLPAMVDRIRLLEHQKQIFGTQWLLGSDNKPYLYPVENFAAMNDLRQRYGLEKLRRPRDLTYGPNQNKPPFAIVSDQRTPSDKELETELAELRDE